MVEIFVQAFGAYDWHVALVDTRHGLVLQHFQPMTGNVASCIESLRPLARKLNADRLVKE